MLYRKGSHEDPMSAAEIDAKFMELAGRSFAPEQNQRIAATVARLEQIADSNELTRLLTAAS